MQDYSICTQMLLDCDAGKWSNQLSKMWANRVPVIRYLMLLRYGIDVPKRKLYNRVSDQEENDRKLEEGTSARDAQASRKNRGRPKLPPFDIAMVPIERPILNPRNVAGAEDIYELTFTVRSNEELGSVQCSLTSATGLKFSESLPPGLLTLAFYASSIYDFQMVVSSPWAFMDQSSFTITDNDETNAKICPLPMRFLDPDMYRKTILRTWAPTWRVFFQIQETRYAS